MEIPSHSGKEETKLPQLETWHEIAIKAYREVTGLVADESNLAAAKIPLSNKPALAARIAKKTGLEPFAVLQCMVRGDLADFIYELSRADG